MREVRSFHVHNFGCRASQADGAAIEAMLASIGMSPAVEEQSAQLVVFNTCTVTAAADNEVRQKIRQAHRENPEASILVTGCYAQRAPAELAQMPGVAWVVGNSHKTRIGEIVAGPGVASPGVPFHGEVHAGDIFAQTDFLSAPVTGAAGDRTRPNLKIQDGCGNRCSFCVIPFVRGRSRSMPAATVIEQIRGLSERYREIVLSGINLGRWGREQGEPGRPAGKSRLVDLLRMILAETPVERLRISSIEPMDLSDDLLGLIAESPRIAKHVHAPLQSGSGAVLRRMRRKYRPRHYEDRIRKARAWMPGAAIGADVMAGFPAESEAEFSESRAFIDSLPFTYLHVFTYSERPGTAAIELPQVPVEIRKSRNRSLRDLGAAKNLEFRQSMIGQTLSAVTLERGVALTGNFLKVELSAPQPANRMIDVKIGELTQEGLRERRPFVVL